MCGIMGFFCLDKDALNKKVETSSGGTPKKFLSEFYEILNRICWNTSERGRDSWGIVGYTTNGRLIKALFSGKYSAGSIGSIAQNYNSFNGFPYSAILNFRGEPSTEVVNRNASYNIQPFMFKNYVVAHNGTISNDKEILENSKVLGDQILYGNVGHVIDSYALLQLAYENFDNKRIRTFDHRSFFDAIEGSYALALFLPDKSLLLARNYRDLAVRRIEIQDVPFLFFASKPKYLKRSSDSVFDTLDSMEPYSYIHISNLGEISTGNISDGLENQTKAIVVISGGLDSTTVATIACGENTEVTLLHFLYDCLAESKERTAVTSIYKYLSEKFPNTKVNLEFFETDLFKKLGGSTITETSLHDSIAKGDEGVETHSEWVPARNTVMCAIAAAYCDRYNIGRIYLGLNMEEGSAFCLPDLGENVIRMWDGSSKKPSEIRLGDKLLSWNEKKKRVEKTKVTELGSRRVNSVYAISVNSGRKWKKDIELEEYAVDVKNQFGSCGIRIIPAHTRKPKVEKNKVYYATGEHPFYVKHKGWVKTKDLVPTDIIMHLANFKQVERNTHNNPFMGVNRSGENNPMSGHLRSSTKKCWCGKKHPIADEIEFKNRMQEVCSTSEHKKKVSQGVIKYLNEVQTEQDKRVHSENTRNGLKLAMKKYKKRTGLTHWNKTDEARLRLSEQTKRLISEGKINPATMNDIPSPNKLELVFMDIFKKNKFKFKFVGDGQVWFTAKDGARMNPDFIDIKNKQIIEVTSENSFWHSKEEKKLRIKRFRKLGWNALYLTDKDIKLGKVISKISKKFKTLSNGMRVQSIEKIDCRETVYTYTCLPNSNFFLGKSGLLTHNCDNTTEFYERMSSVTRIGTQSRPVILNPLGNMMKHEIAKLAYEKGAPIHLSWSCYLNNEKECCSNDKLTENEYCGPCLMKSRALKYNNLRLADFE